MIVHAYTDSIKKDPVDALDLDDPVAVDQFLYSSLWRVPTLEDYELLASESEYAAWTIYNRYYLNHFTIAVHNLKDLINGSCFRSSRISCYFRFSVIPLFNKIMLLSLYRQTPFYKNPVIPDKSIPTFVLSGPIDWVGPNRVTTTNFTKVTHNVQGLCVQRSILWFIGP